MKNLKQYLLPVFFVIVSADVVAQTNAPTVEDLGRLKQKIENAGNDSVISSLQQNVASYYLHRNADSAIFYAEKAIASAKMLNNPRMVINPMGIIIESLIYEGNLPRALEIALHAVDRAKGLSEEKSGVGRVYNALSEIYFQLQDYDKALYYLRKLTRFNNDDLMGVAFGYYGLARIYEEEDQLDSALINLEGCLHAFKNVNASANPYNYETYPPWYNVRAQVYFKKNIPDSALADLRTTLAVTLKSGEAFHTSNTYNDLAAYFRKINNSDSCICYAEKAMDEATTISYVRGMLNASAILAEQYEKKDPGKALYYYKLATENQNKLYSAGNIQAMKDMIAQNEKKQQELALAKTTYQNKLKQYLLSGGLVSLLLIAFILYRNNRKGKAANKVLESTLSNLKSTQSQLIQSEKMASLGELTAGIAHEIQNPLNFVNNFSEVNSELADELKSELATGNVQLANEIAGDIKDNSEKINHHGKRADAIVKGMLQHSRSSAGVKEATDINALCDEYLRLSYHGLRAKDKNFNAEIKTDLDETIGKINIIPQDIGRVVLNLINNAFYAVNEKAKLQAASYEPRVIVSTKKIGGKIEISVKDNGNGIPDPIKEKIFQPFFTTKPTGSGTGLGLSLSYDIIKACGGEIKVESKEGDGTTFIIQLPV